jgi:accessory gene regulator B
LFVLFPFISNYVEIPLTIRITAGILSIVLMFFYAPADTYKHPLVNAKKRLIWKYITTINTFILVCISILVKNNCIANLIIFAIYTEILLINPISYKLLDLPYNNYKKLV